METAITPSRSTENMVSVNLFTQHGATLPITQSHSPNLQTLANINNKIISANVAPKAAVLIGSLWHGYIGIVHQLSYSRGCASRLQPT
jgi:hypothetical protein